MIQAGRVGPEGCATSRTPRRRRAPLILTALALALAAAAGAHAQAQRRNKVISKLTQPGSTQQAFSGKVQSLDLKNEILNVNSVQGTNTEIFPIKKTVDVVMADGTRVKLQALKPGTNILVYYHQKGDHRTVKQIVILAPEPTDAKKAASPS